MNHYLDRWPGSPLLTKLPAISDGGGGQDQELIVPLGPQAPARPESAVQQQDHVVAPDAHIRPTLLVVDDERDILNSVRDMLRLDYHVITFDRGADALEYLRAGQAADVILCDQRMPEMAGVEVLRHSKMLRPETTRLLFTAHVDIRTVIDAINQGHVFRYIAKPCDPDELSVAVRQAVEHHDLVVEKQRLLSELQESNARLLEANRLKTAFIEVASHELNTPVTVMLGLMELWKMAQGRNASPGERQWIERIEAAAARLARTIEKMLKLIRNREFGQSIDSRLVDIESLLRPVIDDLSPYLALRFQAVAVSIEPGLGPFEADPSKISDVLINLLANAIKFTPDGGTIRVEARAEPPHGDYVRVSVRDQGVGISVTDQQHLFEPFFTGFDTLRHSSGDYQFEKRGLGLGLWLVKTFVELHGGRVEVSSTPGSGSTFAFLLPRSQPRLPEPRLAPRDIGGATETRDFT